MKCSGRRAQKSRHADERLSNFREPIMRATSPPQPPYRYRGSHSVMPGHMYMMIMQMITMNM